MMKEQKIRVVIVEDGKLEIDGLPVSKGDEIEVIIRRRQEKKPTFPLRGLPVKYIDPFLPVDDGEWDAVK
jgi:hypothetical protein